MDTTQLLDLLRILKNSEVIAEHQYRKDIIELSRNGGSLYEDCMDVIDAAPQRFIVKFTNIVKKACNKNVETNYELVEFFKLICEMDTKLSEGEKKFIDGIVEELKREKQVNNASSAIVEQLKKERDKFENLQQPSKLITIDRALINEYDLDRLLQIFTDNLQLASVKESVYEGAFVYSLAGPPHILDKYVIQRILKRLQETTEREYITYQVYLNENHLGLGIQDIASLLNVDHFSNLFECRSSKCTDIVLIVWNTQITPTHFFAIAKRLWQEIEPKVKPYLSKPNSRCFIMLWADEHIQSETQKIFLELPVPRRFNLFKFLKWIRVKLGKQGVDELTIARILKNIKAYDGDIDCTYRALGNELERLGRHEKNG
jgi:hypothetical protein